MSTEQKPAQNEELNKSIDTLLEELFSEPVEKGSPLDLAQDNKTTADAAVSQAPSSQKDEARGAGRPKQISDVPQNDMDGRRESEYDDSIADSSGEKEPEEAKKQAQAMDQSSEKNRIGEKPKAPQSRPFKKSEDGTEISEEEYKEFQAFKKAKADEAEKVKQAEELRKTEQARRDQEDLIKSAIAKATESLKKENEDLKKSVSETIALIKAMASQPQRAKSVTSIDALEKSEAQEEKGAETFSKSEVLDAAFELAAAKKISENVVTEIEMTNRCSDAEARRLIERHLEGK